MGPIGAKVPTGPLMGLSPFFSIGVGNAVVVIGENVCNALPTGGGGNAPGAARPVSVLVVSDTTGMPVAGVAGALGGVVEPASRTTL